MALAKNELFRLEAGIERNTGAGVDTATGMLAGTGGREGERE